MGLTIHYELSSPAQASEDRAAALVSQLRDAALDLPFGCVTDIVRLSQHQLAEMPKLDGMAFQRLEDVAHLNAFFTREELYSRAIGLSQPTHSADGKNTIVFHSVEVPLDVESIAYGFAIGVGNGSEPASLGALRIWHHGQNPSNWSWHCSCKTQYASVHGDDNLIRCHHSLVAVLEAAQSIGFAVTVCDETGYWESRDESQLIHSVTQMNKLIAMFAGKVTDATRDAGADSRAVEAEIFKHPDFRASRNAK